MGKLLAANRSDFFDQLAGSLVNTDSGAAQVHINRYVEVDTDNTANDNDKTITIPATELWLVEWVMVEYTATATAGTRDMRFTFDDGSGTFSGDALMDLGVDPTASQTRRYFFTPNAPSITSALGGFTVYVPLPVTTFMPGWTFRIRDHGDVDGNDDMVVHVAHETYQA